MSIISPNQSPCPEGSNSHQLALPGPYLGHAIETWIHSRKWMGIGVLSGEKGSRQIKKRLNKNEVVCRPSPTSKIFLRINNTAQRSFEAVKVMASPALPMFIAYYPSFFGLRWPWTTVYIDIFSWSGIFSDKWYMIKYTATKHSHTAKTKTLFDGIWWLEVKIRSLQTCLGKRHFLYTVILPIRASSNIIMILSML